MLEPNKIYEGFKFKKSTKIKETESEALIFEHENTKAELIALTNKDDNKVFVIAFNTPPNDDTGVPHIIEHCVLNGSKKFPLKEPFAELLKSSLYTFLNAMTYPDRTVYPVASRNNRDFKNLIDVYLDSVFNPLLTKETYFQEGWHYEMNSNNNGLTYSGVVYNEMLGSYSDPENILIDAMTKAMFPENIYSFSSGGDPKSIPDLTFEGFKSFHEKYYHPSNCKIFLYGDFNLIEHLRQVSSYLHPFKHRAINSTVKAQPRFSKPARNVCYYPITVGESRKSKTYILRSYLLSGSQDAESLLEFTILAKILSGNSAAPLRKALTDSHLGDGTLNYGLECDLFETYYSIGLKGTDQENEKEITEIVENTLSHLANNGIDKRIIEAAINSIEFQLREANFGGLPKGLCYGLAMMNSWLYGHDPYPN